MKMVRIGNVWERGKLKEKKNGRDWAICRVQLASKLRYPGTATTLSKARIEARTIIIFFPNQDFPGHD